MLKSPRTTSKRPAPPKPDDILASLARQNEQILAEVAKLRAVLTATLAYLKDEPLIPNAETIEAIEAAERGELSGPFNTFEELLADLNADD
jgi:hypothetical protein